jgi:hypothetical protein
MRGALAWPYGAIDAVSLTQAGPHGKRSRDALDDAQRMSALLRLSQVPVVLSRSAPASASATHPSNM